MFCAFTTDVFCSRSVLKHRCNCVLRTQEAIFPEALQPLKEADPVIYGLIQKEKLRQMYAPAPRPTSVSQIPNPFRKTRRNDTTTRGWRRGTGTRACRRSRLVLGS